MDSVQRFRKRLGSPLASNWLLVALLLAFIVAAGLTAFLTYIAVRELVASWGSQKATQAALAPKLPGAEGQAGSVEINSTAPLQPEGGPAAPAWDGKSRVNILVMGLDYRDWESGEWAPRTDTMILLSLDPESKSAGMLSIPRDLWVDLPGDFEASKINTAYRFGEIYDYPGGGPALAMKTVEELLDMPVQYYVQIDFGAFERFIDEIGGVEVDVPHKIEVDPIEGDTVKLLKGKQLLSGPLALAYARSRNTIGSDFDRAKRQQQVIMGVRQKVLSANMLPTLIKKAPILYSQISAGIKTNLSLLQIVQLAWLAQQIPAESIKQDVIGPNQVTFTYSWDGQDILLPIPDQILLLRDEVFTPSGPLEPVTQPVSVENTPEPADLKPLMQSENANVAVLNGTTTPGLASSTGEYLKSEGINIGKTGNADEIHNFTTILDYTGKPNTVKYLMELLNVSANQIYHRYDPYNQADVVLILGEDWAANNSLP